VTLDLPGPALRPDLLAAGYTDEELRRARRSGEVVAIRRGAYVPSTDERLDDPAARHALAVRAAVAQLPAGAVVSHVSAAVLLGLRVWDVPLTAVHVTRDRTSGGRCGRRLHLHTTPLADGDVVEIDGVPVTAPARTVVDTARAVPFAAGVVVADAALEAGLDPAELQEAVERAGRRPGNARARRVVAFADRGGRSVGESRSRVLLARRGIPPPVLQWPVRDPQGRHIGTADFAWPELGTVGEFDGLVKYGRLLRPGQSPGDAVVAEKRREDRLRDEGLQVARWTWDELDDPDVVVNRLLRAFARADPATSRAIPGGARVGTGASPRTPRDVARGAAGYRGRP
jgi:hypothetical protein